MSFFLIATQEWWEELLRVALEIAVEDWKAKKKAVHAQMRHVASINLSGAWKHYSQESGTQITEE